MIETRARLRLAYMNALNSPDPSSQNGAVATRNGRVVGQGCNDFPPGIEPHGPPDADVIDRWHDKPTKYALVVHAEVAALLDALVHGEQPDTIYVVWATCSECAKTMIAAGVQRVVGHKPRTDADPLSWGDSRDLGAAMLIEAGVEFELYDEPIDTAPIRVSGELWASNKGTD